jgi:predicted nucleic-acid-binding protein
MYSFILKHGSTRLYVGLIAIVLFSGYSFYSHYTRLKESLAEANKTVIEQSIAMTQLEATNQHNVEQYQKQKQSYEDLLISLKALEDIKAQQNSQAQKEESEIKEAIDNAPNEIKECLRMPIPDSAIRSLRKQP